MQAPPIGANNSLSLSLNEVEPPRSRAGLDVRGSITAIPRSPAELPAGQLNHCKLAWLCMSVRRNIQGEIDDI